MSGKRILYIEDNSDNRLLIKRVLEAEGYTVVEAETGLKGLELAASSQPDLILMDINLPEIDGYECTNRLRKIPGGDKVPIIALTANAMEGDAQKALDAGCNGYIPKPIDVDHLPTQIEKYLVQKPEVEAARPAAVQPPSPPPPAPAASTPAPSTTAPGAPSPAVPAPSPAASSTTTPGAPAPGAPNAPASPSVPAASNAPSSSTPAPGAAASPSNTPVVSPSPQPSNAQGQNSQTPGAQPPNPQNRGSQN